MSIIKDLEKDIYDLIKKAGYEVENFILKPSDRPDLGDYQINDSMTLAKIYHKNPKQIAQDIKEKLELDDRFTNINIAGPGFINITLSNSFLIHAVNRINQDFYNNIDKQEYKKIILDYGGANVSKALHVGHLRSANIGEALKRLANLLGCKAISDAHLGDYGRPLGLVLLEIQKRYPDLEYFDSNYEGDYEKVPLPITNEDLEKIYPIASQKAKENTEYLEEARIMTLKIQNHEKGIYDLWKKVVNISKDAIKKVYDMLNVSYDLWNGESDATPYVPELLKICETHKVVSESDGAKIIEVKKAEESSPMPPLLLVKSNGTISYETTDLATIIQRKKEINPDEIWYLADERQSLHFEQVFRATKKANLINPKVNLEYIGFGTMNGTDGKPFKTRDGGIMSLKSLIEMVKEETKKRINYDIVTQDKVEQTVDIIAIATLKYADFIPYRTTDYIFNPAKFSDVEGKTGPYLLYSTIRMKSLLEHAKEIKQETYHILEDESSRNIILTLLRLPSVLTKSFKIKSLNEIAEYLYILTNKYNKFYMENKILIETNHNLQESWLVLTNIVYRMNLLLLDVLGIKVPEKM
ncbi:MAG: arginine--tRNA ligase [Bacilli bacterium]|nr:arginine--tRNA ligase [Bacilli bacterium]